MEKLHLGFMKDLRNFEFEELLDHIAYALEKEKIGIDSLAIVTERIKSHSKELTQMNNVKLTHPLTSLIQEQVYTRNEYLACLRLTVDAKMLSQKPEERIAAKRLELWLRAYKEELYAPSIHTQNQFVKYIINDRKEQLDIQKATAMLNLDELLATIEEVTAKIYEYYIERLNEKDIYEVKGQLLRKAAYKDLRVLINVMDLIYSLSVDDEQKEQLRQLSMTLNAYSSTFHTRLKSRTTKCKNNKAIGCAVKELIGSQQNPQRAFTVGIDEKLQMESSKGSGTDQLKKTYAKEDIHSIKESNSDSVKDAEDTKITDKENKWRNVDGKFPPIGKN